MTERSDQEYERDDEERANGPCPDGGTCHHSCLGGPCWRVANAGPLTGVYPGDRWPKGLR